MLLSIRIYLEASILVHLQMLALNHIVLGQDFYLHLASALDHEQKLFFPCDPLALLTCFHIDQDLELQIYTILI